MNRSQDVRKNDERVRTLASGVIRSIGSYAQKKKASKLEGLRNDSFVVFSVTNLKRVFTPRQPSGPRYPHMEEVREGKLAWVVGFLRQSGRGKQLCVDEDGHGYIVGEPDSNGSYREVEPLTITTLVEKNETLLEEIQSLVAQAR